MRVALLFNRASVGQYLIKRLEDASLTEYQTRSSPLNRFETMAATKSFIARYGFPLLAAVAGAILAGITGLLVGWLLAEFIQSTWRLYKSRPELRAEYQRLKSAHAEVFSEGEREPERERQRAMKILGLAFLAYTVFLLVYSIVISIGRSSAALVPWMKSIQPAVDWLAPLIPTLRKIPLELVERGYADWALAVQHMFFVCWVLTFLLAIWIVRDVMVIHGRASNENFFISGWPFGKLAVIGSVVLAMLLPTLFFGWGAFVFGPVIGLPYLALLFPTMVIFFFLLVGCCNAFLHRSDSSLEAVKADRWKAFYDDMSKTIPPILDGKSKDH